MGVDRTDPVDASALKLSGDFHDFGMTALTAIPIVGVAAASLFEIYISPRVGPTRDRCFVRLARALGWVSRLFPRRA